MKIPGKEQKMKKYASALILLICYLGLHNGHLALFAGRGTQPYQVFPYSSAIYPKLDQDALKEGIPFQSQSELTALLEDYLS